MSDIFHVLNADGVKMDDFQFIQILSVMFFETSDDQKPQEEEKKVEESTDQSLSREPPDSQEVQGMQSTMLITIC